MDLGYDTPDYSSEGVSPGKGKKPKTKTSYPSITLRGPAAAAFCKACAAGDMLDGTVRVKVVRVTDGVPARGEYGGGMDNNNQSVELELEDLDLPGVKDADGDEDEDDSAEGAVDDYLAKKRGGGMDEEMM